MDNREILTRLGSSSVDATTLDELRITVERLCSQYPFRPTGQLLRESRVWLGRTITMLDRKLSLAQRREIQSMAGWLAALAGCLEYDCGDGRAAEVSRRTSWNLGKESGNADVMAWSQEMLAWYALTTGDYRGALDAAETGLAVAPHSGAAVQLHAQKAKAWARLGDRRQAQAALDQGKTVLDQLPHPENPGNHFVIDPAKWDVYCMDCYRVLGSSDTASTENSLAEAYAREVLRTGINSTGFERSPMRNAEARITLGVISARQGDLEQALDYGGLAISGQRLSIPSLLMVSGELTAIIADRYPTSSAAASYLDQLKQLPCHNV